MNRALRTAAIVLLAQALAVLAVLLTAPTSAYATNCTHTCVRNSDCESGCSCNTSTSQCQ